MRRSEPGQSCSVEEEAGPVRRLALVQSCLVEKLKRTNKALVLLQMTIGAWPCS